MIMVQLAVWSCDTNKIVKFQKPIFSCFRGNKISFVVQLYLYLTSFGWQIVKTIQCEPTITFVHLDRYKILEKQLKYQYIARRSAKNSYYKVHMPYLSDTVGVVPLIILKMFNVWDLHFIILYLYLKLLI